VEAPAIRIEPRESAELDRALEHVDRYALVCVTSPNGATLLAEGLMRRGRDARALAGAVVAAIGPGTAAELARFGIGADVIPERAVAESLVDALADVPLDGRPVLIARAADARDVLPDALRDRGAEVDVVALYDTVREPLPDERLRSVAAADYVTFTSSSTVRFLMAALGADGLPGSPRVVSIGPVTSQTAREHGLEVHVEATRHDIDGLLEALLADVAAVAGATDAGAGA
jgi:uroporphyrinogen III methyltransferase/synthase